MTIARFFGGTAGAIFLSGCVTLSGTYVITATRFDGTSMENVRMVAEDRGIYTVVNAICPSNPGATLVIKDAKTGQELKSESPHTCRGNLIPNGDIQAANQKLEAQFSPIRFVVVGTTPSMATAEWAGTPAASATSNSAELRADIIQAFKRICGFDEAQLAETRAVLYRLPLFHEVWVFNDSESERDDKKSAVSVVMKQLPNGGGVDFFFRGACHSKKIPAVRLAS